jgi:hypothetical protein
MNSRLLQYLKRHRVRLLDAWQAEFAAKVSEAGMDVVDAYVQTLDPFYIDLLDLLRGEPLKNPQLLGRIGHYQKNRKPFRLSHLMEIFLTGEEVITQDLCTAAEVDHEFTRQELATYLTQVTQAFDTLIQTYAHEFCDECVKPLLKAHERVIHLAQRNSESEFREKPGVEMDPYE